MTRFLLSFVSVYLLMHAFFYSRVRVLLPGRWYFHALLIVFLILMIFAPIGTRLIERSDHYTLARISGYIGYTWMGVIFYAFWCFLLTGAAGIILKIINMAAGSSLPTFTGQRAVLAVLGAVVLINVYGYFEARTIRVERITIRSAKLPPGTDRVRIAQISDIHLGLLVQDGRISKILDKVDAEKPDIFVSTGDLVDGDVGKIEKLPEQFGRIRPRLGKYAVIGNHEVYAGLARSIRAQEDLGFRVLSGVGETVSNIVNIAGVDDPNTGRTEDEKAILSRFENGLFTILLKHRPEAAPESLGLFDLQLSGHTHYGQLFPFRLFSQMVYPMQNGPYYLPKGSVVYTSRGTGTWGPPIRVLAPPEVTIFDVVRK